jgi:catechol 1,2-dioxygenase/hydroxyquinol 1,2-dioxygenase
MDRLSGTGEVKVTKSKPSFQEHTAIALQQMEGAPPRLREVMASLVRHLHAFAEDVDLTPQEWLNGIAYLTRVGQTCSADRQEFVLLSDITGLSTTVNMLNDRRLAAAGSEGGHDATESSILGPFFRERAPRLPLGSSIAHHSTGPEVQIYGRVLDAVGKPLPGAQVQVWQTDAEGAYDTQVRGLDTMDMRGIFTTDDEGRFYLRSLLPSSYSLPDDGPVRQLLDAQRREGMRPAHIHFLIEAEGHNELVTALYIAGDEFLERDAVFGVAPSLVVPVVDEDPAAPVAGLPAIYHDFHLSPSVSTGQGRIGVDAAQMARAVEVAGESR